MNNSNNITNSYDLPDDYFSGSKAKLMQRMEWISEHETYPLLSKLKGESGFVVPEGYFTHSGSKLELLPFETLGSLSKVSGFVNPHVSDYEKKDWSVLIREELSNYPTLSELPRQNPFDLSSNYFTDSKQRITASIEGPSNTRVINLFRRSVWYAAAAILVIAAGLWLYQGYFNNNVSEQDCTTLACIEKRELLKYKLEHLDNDELYEMVNAEKLEQKLNAPKDTLIQFDTNDAALMDYIE